MGSYFTLKLNIAEENKSIRQSSEKRELTVTKYCKEKQVKQ